MQTPSTIQMVNGSEEKVTFSVPRNGKLVDLEIKSLELNVCFSTGKDKRLGIIFVYDSKTGLLGWNYQYANCVELFLSDNYIYLSDNKLILFWLISSPIEIRFNEFCEPYTTFEEACNKHIVAFENQIDEIERETLKYQTISIFKHVNRRFFYKDRHGSVHGESVAQITDVTYHDSFWQFVLESSGNRQTTLILDEDYQVIDVFGEGAIKT